MPHRRTLLKAGAALTLAEGLGASHRAVSEPVVLLALMPSASHDALALKVLLNRPGRPRLTVDGAVVNGLPMDSQGVSWSFHVGQLEGGRAYCLVLTDADGRVLRPPWTLSTLPAPGALPERFRILFFTCAGGDEAGGFLPIAARQALLDRALTFSPDLAVANGDHVYWDQWTALRHRRNPATRAEIAAFYRSIAWLDEDQPFDSRDNRRAINTIIRRQIAGVYGERFASTPLVFVADDHDYFENDNAGDWGSAFPPRPWVRGLQRLVRDMAYPVALGRPDLGDPWLSEAVETVRIGDLLTLDLYDCRRGWSEAGFLAPEVEAYLVANVRRGGARHHIHAPSVPFGWSAGKLGEWYGDPPAADAPLDDKAWWRPAWFEQHQRLIEALCADPSRAAVSVSGDLHASAAAQIARSDDLDLSGNPLHSILPGPIGTGSGFPSRSRGAAPWRPAALLGQDLAPLEEKNGFTLVDVFPDRMEVRQFTWRPPQPLADIELLEPAAQFVVRRSA